MKSLLKITCNCLVLFALLYSAPVDTGFRLWSQPNGVNFSARLWGDEFAHQMTTDTGYKIIKKIADGYYYYAVLDSTGEFKPSPNKVAIDPPLQESYQLERTAARKAEIESERSDFTGTMDDTQTRFLDLPIVEGVRKVKLGVLLVDFSVSLNNSYDLSDYNDKIFSTNQFYNTVETGEQSPEPEFEQVFGSLWDYYWEQSGQKLHLIGLDGLHQEIINPDDGSGQPEWIYLSNTQEYYDGLSSAETFYDEAVQQAIDNGWLRGVDENHPNGVYDYICFIYAGGWGYGSLWPSSYTWLGRCHVPEKDNVYGDDGFTHIGLFAHEGTHTILGVPDDDLGNWSVTNSGYQNGPLWKGECPAGITPDYRMELGFVTPEMTVTANYSLNHFQYDYNSPSYYVVEIPNSDESFILENRLREGFDEYTPNHPDTSCDEDVDPNGNQGGLLIWHTKENIMIDLKRANENGPDNSSCHEPFPFNGDGLNGNDQDFTDLTIPNSNKHDNTYSHVSIENITWLNQEISANISFYSNPELIMEDTNWYSDHTILSDLYVVNGSTLTIHSGVNLTVMNPSVEDKIQIVVEEGSSLVISGEDGNPVSISSTNNEVWAGFLIREGSTLIMDYAYIYYCNAIKVSSTSDNAVIGSSEIEIWGDSWENNGQLDITDSKITNHGSFIMMENAEDLSIQSSELIDFGIETWGNTTISGTVFRTENNTVAYCISLLNFDVDFEFRNNVVSGYGTGLYEIQPIVNRTIRIIVNNIITYCGTGINLPTDVGTVGYNLLWGNTNDYGSGIQPGVGDITGKDPIFVDPDNNNYHLDWESPCINTGDPNSPLDPDGSPADIGYAYRPLTRGDVNDDGDWTVNDITIIVSFIMGTDTPNNAEEWCADVNGDGSIDVLDTVILSDCITNDSCDELQRSQLGKGTGTALISITPENSLGRWEGQTLIVSLASDVPVRGLQLNIDYDPQAYSFASVRQTEVSLGLQLQYNADMAGLIRVILYPVDLYEIPAGEHDLLNVHFDGLGRTAEQQTVITDPVIAGENGIRLNSGNGSGVPTDFALHPAYPNPFNPLTTIQFDLPEDSEVSLKVYDLNGREVAQLVNGFLSAGYHAVTWDASEYASGAYFVKMTSGEFTQTQKLMLVK